MKIFYHDDNDGKCAGFIARACDNSAPNPDCIPMQYGKEFPFDIIDPGERVYILDYSIEPEEMTKLIHTKTLDIIWIDHHIGAMDKYKDFTWIDPGQWEHPTCDIHGIRKDGIAACELTWQYFSQLDKENFATAMEIPEVVKLIGDRDIWAFKYGERTKLLYYGLKTVDIHPRRGIWFDLFVSPEPYIKKGKVIKEYSEIQADEFLQENGFWVDFHGYKCFACNWQKGSEPYEIAAPDADIWISFYYYGAVKCWTIGLYSKKVDVCEIAKQYEYNGKRGSGHKGAAGFQCEYPPFLTTK